MGKRDHVVILVLSSVLASKLSYLDEGAVAVEI